MLKKDGRQALVTEMGGGNTASCQKIIPEFVKALHDVSIFASTNLLSMSPHQILSNQSHPTPATKQRWLFFFSNHGLVCFFLPARITLSLQVPWVGERVHLDRWVFCSNLFECRNQCERVYWWERSLKNVCVHVLQEYELILSVKKVCTLHNPD